MQDEEDYFHKKAPNQFLREFRNKRRNSYYEELIFELVLLFSAVKTADLVEILVRLLMV